MHIGILFSTSLVGIPISSGYVSADIYCTVYIHTYHIEIVRSRTHTNTYVEHPPKVSVKYVPCLALSKYSVEEALTEGPWKVHPYNTSFASYGITLQYIALIHTLVTCCPSINIYIDVVFP